MKTTFTYTFFQYLIRLIALPWSYYALSASLGAVLYIRRKDAAAALLAFYMGVGVSSTILCRRTMLSMHYILRPFWSWQVRSMSSEILANILLFIPIGFLAAKIRGSRRGLAFAVTFSALIEIVQLLTRRGFFEVDDILHNTLGAAVGVGLWLLVGKWQAGGM